MWRCWVINGISAICRASKGDFFDGGGCQKRLLAVDFLSFLGGVLWLYQRLWSGAEGPKTSDSACHWLQIVPITAVNCGVNTTFRVVKLQYLIM